MITILSFVKDVTMCILYNFVVCCDNKSQHCILLKNKFDSITYDADRNKMLRFHDREFESFDDRNKFALEQERFESSRLRTRSESSLLKRLDRHDSKNAILAHTIFSQLRSVDLRTIERAQKRERCYDHDLVIRERRNDVYLI